MKYIITENKIKALEKFLSTYEVEGICGFWVDQELDENEMPWVYMILDKDWAENTNLDFVVRRMKLGVKKEIYNFLNIDVEIGVTMKKCEESKNIQEQTSQSYISDELIKKFLSSNNLYWDIGHREPYSNIFGRMTYCSVIHLFEKTKKNLPTLNIRIPICMEKDKKEWKPISRDTFDTYVSRIQKTKLVYLGAEDVANYFIEKSKDYLQKLIDEKGFN